jgi:exopolyphosphatase / guanosine-5'-triphosphate,3'-diphosphate pyrophosphatase
MRRIAVIDMGSNSFRLVVYGYEPGGPWMLTDEIREAVRLSAGMGEERLLRPEPMERALGTAEVFASFASVAGVEDVVAVGTSAIRDAANRDELLGKVRERTGLEVRVLSAEEEARYAYIAMVNSTTLSDGFGVDLGGGSVQLMRVEDRRLRESVSLPLGAVRVSEAFLPDDEASKKQVKALRTHARELLEPVDWLAGAGGRLVGVGGSLRNLASAAAKEADLPDLGVQGFLLTADALAGLVDELAARPASKRGTVPGIKPDRGDVILGAALVFQTVLEVGGFEGIEVSEEGLREGIFFERFLAPADPPLLDDVRRQSVLNLSNRFRFEPAHVRHVATLSRELYDGLARAGVVAPDDADRELLWAASMVHDIGVSIAYDDHHKPSGSLVLHAGLPGFDQRELALVARTARFHRKGDPTMGELSPLARKGDEERLALLSGVIRVAEQLERSRDQSIESVGVEADGADAPVKIHARATRDGEVALWAARRNDDLLEQAIGRPVEIDRG